MRPGDAFNPWRGDDKTPGCGFNPADVVCMQRTLTQGQKLLYERLVRFAGRDGHCFPCQETLASLLGVSDRQTRKDLAALETAELIRRRKRLDRRSDTFEFLWHEVFQETRKQPSEEAQSSGLSGTTVPVNLESERNPGSGHQTFERNHSSGQSDGLSGTLVPGGWNHSSGLSGTTVPPNTVQEIKALSPEFVDRSRAGFPRTIGASAPAPLKNPFEEFQNAYPEAKRGVKVESAGRAYVGRIHGTSGEHAKLMAGLARYKASADWQRALGDCPDGRFLPTMERFIADGLYLDSPAPADGFEESPQDCRRVPPASAPVEWDPASESFVPMEANAR